MAINTQDQEWGNLLKIKDTTNEGLIEQNNLLKSIAKSLMIAGKGGSPGQPYDDPEKGKGPFVPAPPRPKLLAGVELPNFKPMGRVIEGTRKGVLPMNETKIKQPLQLKQASLPSSRSIRDKLKPFTHGSGYDKEGGSLRGIPDPLRIQLLRDAMAKLPANNIRRFGDSGHQLVIDDENPNRLKIIKQFEPPKA